MSNEPLPPPADDPSGVIRLRRKLGLTQAEFCERYGLSLDDLLGWELQVVEPDAVARMLLAVIEAFPELAAIDRAGGAGPRRLDQEAGRFWVVLP